MLSEINKWLTEGLSLLASLFVFFVGVLVIIIVIAYIIDITQTKHTIRRNYPVIGRFRYLFEYLGEFFRQYFFSMDREEMPFNRAERSWIYRAAKKIDNTVAFGSTKNLSATGTYLFANSLIPVQNEDAEPAASITIGPYVKNAYTPTSFFNISGMSYGAISKPAVRALAQGAKKAGCWFNTGEGGLSSYHLEGGCDIVFQIGTAKYGVRDEHGCLSAERLKLVASHTAVKMFEIKLSQGAKPGKGGILPAAKVTKEIAKIRGIPIGKTSESPNRHKEIHTIDDLLDMIKTVRDVTEKPVGIKLVLGQTAWLDELCEAILQRGIEHAPDFITLDGGDGGTGASPLTLIDCTGLTLKESLPILVDKLIEYNLKDRIKVICSGKLINPAGVAWALCVGADFITSARGFMFSLGCIQALQCNKNTCPTGITTQNKKLQRGLNPADKSVRVANYVERMVDEVNMLAHSCGVTEPHSLRRHHVRIVQANGYSIVMDELNPYPEIRKINL